MQPSEVRLSAAKDALTLVFGSGAIVVSAQRLRENCRAAGDLSQALTAKTPPHATAAKIVSVALVGSYGLNIAFDDGSDRGIYPWSFLQSLANEAQA